ncbi:MAG: GIY-YIG nuclease family protein [Fibrobacter sp.]|nr:GIY-YIG nuclease family protein [Fibrobacter sp.]
MQKRSYVYIMTDSKNCTMYVGVTADLKKRMQYHLSTYNRGFTSKYNVHRLVYYEVYSDIRDAIVRESQLKNWKRVWKNALVMSKNPTWEDMLPQVLEYNPVG